ncbi:glycoside hydrolase family 19 protein [Streptomyces fuscigenes]|uniref:glycoside hydrolase family 19 protein n=1 Tax=Streptomyces fuscigenes TaxID=1528880 RepID=UPI001F48183C|nr:glycoside hydrolase family 19 protein [Streptomyces fuscigenes]MCF3963689.1 ricin-type beta-trefoil lectin domain protein [Streptomyces fuscigenes]
MLRQPPRGLLLVRSAAALAVAALLSLLFTVPAQAADPVGQITGLGGKCVDVAAANSANGTPVQLYDCNGSNAQQWTIAGDGTVRALGKCLDVVGGGTGDGALVQLWDCTGAANQKWSVNSAHDIVGLAANKCLDVKDRSTANGTRLQIWTCTGQSNQKWNAAGTNGSGNGGNPGSFVVSEAQFNQMFPSRNGFYTYQGLVNALGAYPGFARTGSDTTQKQEAAAFLANVAHETGNLQYVVEQNTANYPHYCDTSQPYGCPAGQSAYYGRGPIQLSWNFNYKAAGDALGIDLLDNPNLVQQDAAIAWKTGLWYWDTQTGPGTMTPHDAMVNGRGFGETIRSINGSIECNGGNPAQVQSRVANYQRFVGILGVPAGSNLSC